MLKKDSYFYYASANALFYFAWAMFASMITVYLAGESLSTSQISWITSASSLFAIISQPICGLIADKIQSPKLVSIVCGVLTIISGIFFAYTHSFLLLFLLNGFTQGCMNGLVILTDRLATACPYGYGGIRLWGSVAYAVGAQVSGMIYQILFAQANYIIFAISMLIMIACLFMMRDQKAGSKIKKKSNQVTFLNIYSPTKHLSILSSFIVYIKESQHHKEYIFHYICKLLVQVLDLLVQPYFFFL